VSPVVNAAGVAALIAAFAAVATERARSYALSFSAAGAETLLASSIALGASVVVTAHGNASATSAIVLALCAVNAATDLGTGYIFDRVLGAGGVSLLGSLFCGGNLSDAAGGAAIAGGMLAIPFALSRARGLGFGDVKFAAILGLGLGASRAVRALLFACVLGGVWGLLLLRRAGRRGEMRFGPFLAMGAACALAFP
jgi:leader peptidase (prepilin peptidase)/N-methyltransferase